MSSRVSCQSRAAIGSEHASVRHVDSDGKSIRATKLAGRPHEFVAPDESPASHVAQGMVSL